MNWQMSYDELFMGRCHIQFRPSLYDTWSITFWWTFTFCLSCDFLPRKLDFDHWCYPTGVKLWMSTPQALSSIFKELREALLRHFQNWQYTCFAFSFQIKPLISSLDHQYYLLNRLMQLQQHSYSKDKAFQYLKL